MAYNTSPGRSEYTATAGQTVFPFVFKIYVETDIKVYLTPVGQTPDDTVDLLTLGTDYTVVITGDSGGSITLLTGATLNDAVTLKRDLPVDRTTEYQTSGDLLATTLNADQDYQTYLIGDKEADNERALRVAESVQGVDTVLPNPEPLSFVRWNADADKMENVILQISGGTQWRESHIATAGQTIFTVPQDINADTALAVFVNGSLLHPTDYTTTNNVITLLTASEANDEVDIIGGEVSGVKVVDGVVEANTIADMLLLDTSAHTTCIVKDLSRGGTFNYDSTQSAVNNGGTIFDGWVREYSGAVNVKWFGAKGDGVTDDAGAINSAIDQAYIKGEDVYLPAGTYYLTSDRINIRDAVSAKSYKNINVFGDGWNTIIHSWSSGGRDLFQMNNVHDIVIRDLAITATIETPTTQGTNAFSLTSDCSNITIRNVYCYDLPYTDNGTYGDGGAAFSIQTHLAKNITIDNCKAYNCKYGHDFSCDGALLAASDYNAFNIVATNNTFEYCYKGIVYGYSDTGLASLSVPGLNILISDNTIKDCQYGMSLGRLSNANIKDNVITNRLTTQPAWLALFPDVYGIQAGGLFDSIISDNTIDYKNANSGLDIGGTTGASATILYSNNLIVAGNNIICDSPSTGYVISANSVGGNVLRNSILNNIADSYDPLFSTLTYDNIILDDCEDSTWTPILADGNLADEGATYTARYGRYSKTRNLVTFSCYLQMSGLGTLSGNASIIGLPYASANIAGAISSCAVGFAGGLVLTAPAVISARIGQNSSHITLSKTDATSTSGMVSVTTAEISATGILAISGSYTIN